MNNLKDIIKSLVQIEKHSIVKLLCDIKDLKKNTIGTVIKVCDNEMYEIEFQDSDNNKIISIHETNLTNISHTFIDNKYLNYFKEYVFLIQSDICLLKIDAIVNAANKSLLGGGGVDGIIHNTAGPELLEECKKLNGCNVGESKITKAYKLPSKYIIHTVGPLGENPEYLEKCYINSLDLAKHNNVKSIAFPCISTGIYRYPQINAAKIAISSVSKWLIKNKNHKIKIIFCVYLNSDLNIYSKLLQV
jgi:O-acetyl-ADP-ribose deacetylase (regulator of RNase III)